jgi:hypothetical protein
MGPDGTSGRPVSGTLRSAIPHQPARSRRPSAAAQEARRAARTARAADGAMAVPPCGSRYTVSPRRSHGSPAGIQKRAGRPNAHCIRSAAAGVAERAARHNDGRRELPPRAGQPPRAHKRAPSTTTSPPLAPPETQHAHVPHGTARTAIELDAHALRRVLDQHRPRSLCQAPARSTSTGTPNRCATTIPRRRRPSPPPDGSSPAQAWRDPRRTVPPAPRPPRQPWRGRSSHTPAGPWAARLGRRGYPQGERERGGARIREDHRGGPVGEASAVSSAPVPGAQGARQRRATARSPGNAPAAAGRSRDAAHEVGPKPRRHRQRQPPPEASAQRVHPGVRRGVAAVPRSACWYHQSGSSTPPHCRLNRCVPPPGVQRPKLNTRPPVRAPLHERPVEQHVRRDPVVVPSGPTPTSSRTRCPIGNRLPPPPAYWRGTHSRTTPRPGTPRRSPRTGAATGRASRGRACAARRPRRRARPDPARTAPSPLLLGPPDLAPELGGKRIPERIRSAGGSSSVTVILRCDTGRSRARGTRDRSSSSVAPELRCFGRRCRRERPDGGVAPQRSAVVQERHGHQEVPEQGRFRTRTSGRTPISAPDTSRAAR